MPVLAYCITEKSPAVELSVAGVQGRAVETLEEAGIRCFLSRYREGEAAYDQPVREAALAFNRVLQEILRQITLVPFRFPTMLANEAELSGFLREHAGEYSRALSRLRDTVQMEVHMSLAGSRQSQVQLSGIEYLRMRQESHRKLQASVQELRQATSPWVRDWSQREVRNGVRCYALVDRASSGSFLAEARRLQFSPGIAARATGPWPATEFLEESNAGR